MLDFASDNFTIADVCRELKITPSDVHRLVSEGYLDVVATSKFKHGVAPLFNEDQVSQVREQIPGIRRRWDQNRGARRGEAAAQKRLKDWRSFHHTRERKERFLKSLVYLPERSGELLRASYYLYHLNHYAKAGETYLYDLKEQVLEVMSDLFTSEDGLEIYVIPGPDRIRLCPGCQARARKEKKTYLEYSRLTGGCSSCQRDEGYFSLYEFQVVYDEHHFCFHSPVQIARRWLKGMEIPVKENSEREGGYPFGRPIFAGEAAAVNLAEVVDELKAFLRNCETTG